MKYLDDILDDTEGIANYLQDSEKIIQILYVRESDAIIAASIFARVFYDLQRPCMISEFKIDKSFDFSINQKTIPLLIGIEPEQLEGLSIERDHITLTCKIYQKMNNKSISLEKYGFTEAGS